MKITLHNIDKATGVIEVEGPHVPVVLGDSGRGHVDLLLALSNGMSFHFPDAAGRGWPQQALLAPGDYACNIVIAAHGHGAFARAYDSGIVVGELLVGQAEGDVPGAADVEIGHCSFVLRVK